MKISELEIHREWTDVMKADLCPPHHAPPAPEPFVRLGPRSRAKNLGFAQAEADFGETETIGAFVGLIRLEREN